MRSSPKPRPNGWDALVVLAVLALAAGSALAVWGGRGAGTEPLTAVVSVDGREADRFPPEDLLEGSRTYSNNGYTLTVAFGIDYNGPIVEAIRERCSFIAPVHVYAGENELEALALNALVVLRGVIEPKKYL